MSYSKLHSSVVQSSLWTEPDHVRLLFVTLLALADREGYVYGSRVRLLQIANITPAGEVNPWDVLLGPDPNSSDLQRAPENEGRRVEEVPGGFHLLNFEYYRGLRNDDDRRVQNRESQARWRDKNKRQSARAIPRKPESAGVSQGKRISEAEAEAEAEKERNSSATAPPREADRVMLTFSTTGKIRCWDLTEAQLVEWEQAYYPMDVMAECRKALVWLEANHKKTAFGMPRFLVSWFNRANDNSRPPAPRNGEPRRPTNRAPSMDVYNWTCPHTPPCEARGACDVKQRIEEGKRL